MKYERDGFDSKSSEGLRRELGLLDATMMGLGSAVNAGVFVILGQAAEIAGGAGVIVVTIVGLTACLTSPICNYSIV
jgi:APA family basic amino acid/polyamine antiporter